MGLLDTMGDDGYGLLSMGLRLMSTPGSFGQAVGQSGLGALGDMQQFEANRQRQAMADMQIKQARAQMEELARQERERQAIQNYATQALTPTAPINANNASGIAGPRPEALQAVGQVPGFDLGAALKSGVPIGAALQLQQSMQKDTSPLTVKEGETLLDRKTMRPIFANPKAKDDPADWRLYQLAGGDAKYGSFDNWDLARRRATATSVSVNTGQKGFDNTLKLRGDFRSEPIYKAHQEMQSAYAQIQQSLKQASPAGDLAGATKIMKLLDPGSVVRESELGMAMQATGLLDRAQNYAQMILKGTKLTPDQRQDFQRLADALYRESVNQYNAKRTEYQGIAERNGLSTADVLGPESSAPPRPNQVLRFDAQGNPVK